jgi:hypothetical protein
MWAEENTGGQTDEHTHGIEVDNAAVLAVYAAALHKDHAEPCVAVDAKADDRGERPNACENEMGSEYIKGIRRGGG